MPSTNTNRQDVLSAPLSRREAIASAALSPLADKLTRRTACADPTVTACRKWLAVEADRRCLQLAWSEHEAWLARTRDWYRLSPSERAAIPEGAKLAEIDAQLDVLELQSQLLLEALPLDPAASVAAVIANLSVAEGLLADEHRPEIRGLLIRAIRDLSILFGQE